MTFSNFITVYFTIGVYMAGLFSGLLLEEEKPPLLGWLALNVAAMLLWPLVLGFALLSKMRSILSKLKR